MGENKKKKERFGPSGSAISRADAYTGWHPGMSPDVGARYYQHYKVPAIRMEPESMSAEEFKELLAQQDQKQAEREREDMELMKQTSDQQMTPELFFELYNDPTAKQGYRARKAKKRLIQALIHFREQDAYLWVNEQMFILESYIDQRRKEFREQQMQDWKEWKNNILEKVQERYPVLIEIHGELKAKKIAEAAWDYVESFKPKGEPHEITKQIRRRMRNLTLRQEYQKRREYSEGLEILGTGKRREPPQPKQKKQGIREIWEETPEQDNDFVVKVTKEELFRERAKLQGYTDKEVNHFLKYINKMKK